MTIHSETKLEEYDYDLPGWVHVYNRNIDLLNDALLKARALLDVSDGFVPDGGLLVWNATSSKWVVRKF